MSKQAILEKVIALHKMYHDGAIPTLAEHEVHPGFEKSSRENYLYFTLPPCLNFQRSSPAMWQAALKTWEDPETQYLFFPEETVKRTFEEIQRDLVKHKLALQKNKHTEIWRKISHTLAEHFEGNPQKVMERGEYDAQKILDLIQNDMRKSFPYISGPKMANYWLYILSQFTDVKLTNMQTVSIIPDTHVIQCSAKLGLTAEDATSLEVAAVWKDLLQDSPLTPVDMHPVLWNWSRNNFLPVV